MEAFSALLALRAGNSLATGEHPIQMPVTWSFHVFYDLRLTNAWANNRYAGDWRRNRVYYGVTVMQMITPDWNDLMYRNTLWSIYSNHSMNCGISFISVSLVFRSVTNRMINAKKIIAILHLFHIRSYKRSAVNTFLYTVWCIWLAWKWLLVSC